MAAVGNVEWSRRYCLVSTATVLDADIVELAMSNVLALSILGAPQGIHDVPITFVTNGVHVPTWVSPMLRNIFERRIGRDWQRRVLDPERWEKDVQKITDEELWNAHGLMKQKLVAFIRNRAFHDRLQRGE